MINNGGANLGQVIENEDPAANGRSFTNALQHTTFSLTHLLIAFLYSLYKKFTLLNLIIFIMKYVPTGLYIYKTIQNFYTTSRERIKMKEIELEDIQLKIQIVNTKLSVRDAEFSERTEVFRRKAERLRMLRAKVRHMISTDEELNRALQVAPAACSGRSPVTADELAKFTSEEENEFIVSLLKELTTSGPYEYPQNQEKDAGREAGERTEEQVADDGSVYSSIIDPDDSQDCRVKIVKVTNVYRVACLKHYVKQKRVRRASQQVLLQKKIENIKKMLESWQKSLHAVLYNKIILDKPPIDLASQEAMGDYKPYLREFSDSDSELKTNGDTCYDDFNGLNWSQNPYEYNYDPQEAENGGDTIQKQVYNTREYAATGAQYSAHCICNDAPANVLFILPEETSSQMAIAENGAERDLMAD